MAKAAVARHDGASPAFIESMHAQATTAARQADALALISLVVTVAAGACFFFSIQTHESRWDAIPLGLGLVYVALLWLQV